MVVFQSVSVVNSLVQIAGVLSQKGELKVMDISVINYAIAHGIFAFVSALVLDKPVNYLILKNNPKR